TRGSGSPRSPPDLCRRLGRGLGPAGEDLAQSLDVVALDQRPTLRTILTEPVDQLRPQDVDLAAQDPAAVRDLLFLRGQVVDQLLELLVAHRADVGEGFFLHALLAFLSGERL